MSTDDAGSLRKKIQALIVFRVIFVTLLLGSSYLFRGLEGLSTVYSISYPIISLYILTIIYSLLLKRIKNLAVFAYIQLVLDVVFEILLIYITGVIESWFTFTLILTVISSSIILNKKAGYFIATLSSLLYGILVNLHFYRVLPIARGSMIDETEYFYNIFVNIVALYLTAYLSGYLSSRLEKTEQRLEEKALDLRELEVFNTEVLENMQTGLFTTDTTGKVVMFNRTAEKITGIQRASIIGQKIDTVLPYFRFPFSEGRNEEIKVGDGSNKIIGLGVSVMKGAGENTRGFIGIFQDLTHIKRLESEMKQKEKWAAIGELSSSIAHEIRNPLASLKGSIEMLKEDTVPGDYRKRLMDIALKEMERLNRIITDFLTYSRPSAPEFIRFDIHNLLDDIIEILRNVETGKEAVTIKKEYSGGLEAYADPQKMRQVFWNLGINAIEAMRDSGGNWLFPPGALTKTSG